MQQTKTIYFDHNATSPLLPEIKEQMDAIALLPLNTSSVHSYGKMAKKILETSRANLLRSLNAPDRYQAIFTSTGTEANNIALSGMVGYHSMATVIEHPSVLNVAKDSVIPVDVEGVVDLNKLEQLLSTHQHPVIVSVMMANNEVGVIQPMEEIIHICRRYKAIIHTDASQSFGRLPIDLEKLDVDLLTMSVHKCGGPLGSAALIFKKDLRLHSIIQGGGQEYGFRPGTVNVHAIYGLGILCSILQKTINSFQKLRGLRDHLEYELKKISNEVIIFAQNALRLPNTSSIAMPGVLNETQLIHFDLSGFAVSAGSACSSGKVDAPYVQMAMGYTEADAKNSIRVSLGPKNTNEEVKNFIQAWKALFLKSSINDDKIQING